MYMNDDEMGVHILIGDLRLRCAQLTELCKWHSICVFSVLFVCSTIIPLLPKQRGGIGRNLRSTQLTELCYWHSICMFSVLFVCSTITEN